jgi:hypothetical protein
LKIVSAWLFLMNFDAGVFHTYPDDVAAVQNERFGSV